MMHFPAIARRLAGCAIFCLMVPFLAVSGAQAASSAWFDTEQGGVRLIAASDAVGRAESLSLGLHFRLKPGWKVYWRSPGDAGFPPSPEWAGSDNLATVQLSWPAPERFSVLRLQTLGYRDEVVLPLDVAVIEPGRALKIRAQVRYLTCSEICVPYDAKLSLDLPAGPEISTPEEGLIRRFAALVPPAGPTPELAITGAAIDGPPGRRSLRIEATSDRPFGAPDLIVEGPAGYGFGKPRPTLVSDGRGAQIRLAVYPPPVLKPKPGEAAVEVPSLIGARLTVTLLDGSRSVEQSLRASPGAAVSVPPPVSVTAIAAILALAVLGGLILNLMPCVLPVLSLKMLSVIGHGGGTPGNVRAGFMASAAGILVSFLILASAAVAMKWSGHAVGWGIQFQQPLFLIAMTLLLTLFAANLWGLFEVRLPRVVADLAAKAGGPSDGSHDRLGGHFATGMFATLLATPCSAPFLGTAIGFALARGAVEIYAVFTALGIGLALPYLTVAAFPRLATRLPRPGHWMVTLRRILALALAATAMWLITVLASQAGQIAASVVAALMVAVVLVFALTRTRSDLRGRAIWASVAVLALIAFVAPGQLPMEKGEEVANSGRSADAGAIQWRRFDPAAIPALVASGKVVFVDVTADWCLSCKVNKAVVLDRDLVVARFRKDGIVAMQADWTRPDAGIAAFLQSFSRYGVPFNVVFGPGAPTGRVLPELLTSDAVLAGLDRASGTRRRAAR